MSWLLRCQKEKIITVLHQRQGIPVPFLVLFGRIYGSGKEETRGMYSVICTTSLSVMLKPTGHDFHVCIQKIIPLNVSPRNFSHTKHVMISAAIAEDLGGQQGKSCHSPQQFVCPSSTPPPGEVVGVLLRSLPPTWLSEAAYTLLLYDELLEWSDRPLREFLAYPLQTEWQRKEQLHLAVIQNFDRGKVSGPAPPGGSSGCRVSFFFWFADASEF